MKKLAQICRKSFIAIALTLTLACPVWSGEIPQPLPPPPLPVVGETPHDASAPVEPGGQTSDTATQTVTAESLAEALLTLLQNSFALF